MTSFLNTVELYRRGAETLPGEYFTSPGIFLEESAVIFARSWNYAGYAERLSRPGDYLVRDVAGESILVVRDRDGVLRAFLNVCRHRGTRLCREPSGCLPGKIRCPYHAWTYGTDGQLLGAPHMQEVPGFQRRDYPLYAAKVAEHEGFVFVSVDPAPAPFSAVFAPMCERFARRRLGGLTIAHSVRYEVRANWKLIVQNYSECLHCPVVHPELASILPHQSGGNDLVDGPFLGGYLDLAAAHDSVTSSGRMCGRPIDPSASESDKMRAFFYTLMPNMMIDIYPDYASTYLLTPLAVDRTLVEFEMLFAPHEPDDPLFNPRDAIELAELTNRQDWETLALAQLGVSSRAYRPGPYSPPESMTLAWDREYLRLMGRAG
jgi:Rieske 2Fe-2S family protein